MNSPGYTGSVTDLQGRRPVNRAGVSILPEHRWSQSLLYMDVSEVIAGLLSLLTRYHDDALTPQLLHQKSLLYPHLASDTDLS
jgi:hypothetical protein